MKAACFSDVHKVIFQELPDPLLQSDTDALIEVSVAGLCGSDLHPYFGRETGIDPGTAMGHEFAGRVAAVGSEVSQFRIGDRVCVPFTTSCGKCPFCLTGLTARCVQGQLFGWRENGQGLHGGQATKVRVPLADSTLFKIPDAMDDETAILLGDNLSTAFYATELAQIDQLVSTNSDHSVAIIGCGTVGLLAIQWAKSKSVNNIIAVEPNPYRRELAQHLGAITAANTQDFLSLAREASSGLGVNAVMEFVGLPEAQRTAYEIVRPGGTLATIGCHCSPHFAFSPSEAYDKNLSYRSGRCSARHYMETARKRSSDLKMDLSWCVTHRFPLSDATRAYETFAHRKDNCVKAVFCI